MITTSTCRPDKWIEFDPAEFADAAYRVLLRSGLAVNWLSIQLELWRAMTEQAQKMERTNVESFAHPQLRQHLNI